MYFPVGFQASISRVLFGEQRRRDAVGMQIAWTRGILQAYPCFALFFSSIASNSSLSSSSRLRFAASGSFITRAAVRAAFDRVARAMTGLPSSSIRLDLAFALGLGAAFFVLGLISGV